jgi:hypothetical protein
MPKVSYMAVTGSDLDQVMTQTHCQGAFFDWAASAIRLQTLETHGKGSITARVELNGSETILAIRGETESGTAIPYGYLTLGSSWQILRKNMLFFKLCLAIITVACVYNLMCKTKGYVRIKDEDEELYGL